MSVGGLRQAFMTAASVQPRAVNTVVAWGSNTGPRPIASLSSCQSLLSVPRLGSCTALTGQAAVLSTVQSRWSARFTPGLKPQRSKVADPPVRTFAASELQSAPKPDESKGVRCSSFCLETLSAPSVLGAHLHLLQENSIHMSLKMRRSYMMSRLSSCLNL